MRRLACMMLVLAMAAGPAQAAPWWAPSPLSIVLTVGSWMMKDRVEVFYVRVQAHGRDEADARDQAFRLAVNQAVGSLLLSHTEIRNGEVLRRDIINYSSGHIHDFQILNRESRDGGILLQADVWVRKSQIADRLLNESRAAGRIEGGRISAQIDSFQAERQGADRVLGAVLADYPRRAFDITVGNTRVSVHNRVTYLEVPVSIRWNQKFVASLAEAVRTVNPNPQCGGWLADCRNIMTRVTVGRQQAWFDDDKTYWIFHRAMIAPQPQVLLELQDSRGITVEKLCFQVPQIDHSSYVGWYFADLDGGDIRINANFERSGPMMLETQKLPINQLDRVAVSVVPLSQCP
jgi:hypothetical protein